MASTMFIDISDGVQQALAEARQVAQMAFADLLRSLTTDPEQRRLWDVEETVWQHLWALGRALMRLWFVARCPRSVPRTVWGPDGRSYRWHGLRPTVAKTRFGEIRFQRPFYIHGDGRRGDTYVPFDQEVGLPASRFSLRVIGFASYLTAKMAFAEVAGTLRRFWGWAPATKSLLKMVDQVGPLARPFLEAEPGPSDDGEIIVVEADGGGAPMITDTEMSRRRKPHKKRPRSETGMKWRRTRRRKRPRKRRKKGDKSKNAKIATVGVIYTIRRTPDGQIEGPIHKRVYATFRNAEALFVWLRAEANKRGYATKRVVFLADGDRKLWKLQQRYFPKAEACIDWCHVAEKIWAIGETLFAEGSDELAAWVAAQTADLRMGHATRVVRRLQQLATTLPRSGPGTKGRRERMRQGIQYLKSNLNRMPYAKLHRAGLPIGSGAIEGAIRQLVRMRLDGPGMRWSPARAEHILQMRCVVLNGQWDDFMEHVVQQAHSVGLREQAPPGLGRTHNAKRKKAA
jgi:hypothetical protein